MFVVLLIIPQQAESLNVYRNDEYTFDYTQPDKTPGKKKTCVNFLCNKFSLLLSIDFIDY